MTEDEQGQSEAIQQYIAEHPDASPEEVAKALEVKAGLVYQEKANLYARRKVSGSESLVGAILGMPVQGRINYKVWIPMMAVLGLVFGLAVWYLLERLGS